MDNLGIIIRSSVLSKLTVCSWNSYIINGRNINTTNPINPHEISYIKLRYPEVPIIKVLIPAMLEM